MLEKKYDAKLIEERIAQLWQDVGVFTAGAGADSAAASFSIVMPPPNVTGSLHMGHALNSTIQDIMIRFQRMRGKNVLWQPGLDHAGIATQMVVERQLAAQGRPSRFAMGRSAFIDEIWRWREESGGMIVNQLRRLGVSCDWQRERFTMDEGLSKAVIDVFVTLYRDGLIYKDKRLVNWDPHLQTAISDLEVEQRPSEGSLWHMRYPLADTDYDPENPASFITIATTRPETLLGDSAIAVNPNDERYQHLIGRSVILPIIGRKLTIIADDYIALTMGSGAVKITPAHDFNDFEIAKRHNLRLINIFDKNAALFLKDNAEFVKDLPQKPGLERFIEQFNGKDRYIARKEIVALLSEQGYMAKIEKHQHVVPYGDRSSVVIEPFLTEQWYVNAKILAQPAINAVKSGLVEFIPQNWEKTFFQWMENIQPWCISRQLWWGHQIPAWYGPDGAVFVARTEEEAISQAQAHYGRSDVSLRRDEDVLDTWFSSALWPFSTLGWPEDERDLQLYYPTSVLVTGFDIIFFWVARMMMMGLYFIGKVPFHKVYVHALVRDKFGAKMSKSKGNVIDPLILMEEYGADALRFTLAIMAAQGRDVRLDPKRIEGYRNFATKIWNGTRFAQLNEAALPADFCPTKVELAVNRWLLSLLSDVIADVTQSLENYRFNEAADRLYRFIWGSFCDWYLEFTKAIFSKTIDGENSPPASAQEPQPAPSAPKTEIAAQQAEIRAVLAFALDKIYKLLHPFMPFITEELSAAFLPAAKENRPASLAISNWPSFDFHDNIALKEIEALTALIADIRSIRKELNVPAKAKLDIIIQEADHAWGTLLRRQEVFLQSLARINAINWQARSEQKGIICCILSHSYGQLCYGLPLGEVIDFAKEKQRLIKEKEKLADSIAKLEQKLQNPQFLAKAAPEILQADKERLVELQNLAAKNALALAKL